MSQAAVLVVEDDLSLREALCDTLEMAGYPVLAACDGNDAVSRLRQMPQVGMVVSDVQMQPMDGFELLQHLRQEHPQLPVVMMTAYGTIQKAVEAMQAGAVDYLVKPFDADRLVNMVQRHLMAPTMDEDVDLVAVDARSQQLAGLAKRVAASDATVMITGDSGCGKEVYARYIHRHSSVAEGPFVAINCAAIPENMLEAVLFGYEKGAFTGAYSSNPGKFEQANDGTLLLDEISEMDLGLQAKLLRVLQEREVERLGGKKTIPLNVRVLATSNRNLREEVAAGRFREDLFYRLNVFPLQLLPLAERPDDIIPLARRLLERWCRHDSRPALTESAEQKLLAHSWPGNVRELDNVMQRALILRDGGHIDGEQIIFEQPADSAWMNQVAVQKPDTDQAANEAPPVTAGNPVEAEDGSQPRLGDDLKNREQQMILEVLHSVGGSRKQAAERLGISPRTLRYKLARMRDAGVELPA